MSILPESTSNNIRVPSGGVPKSSTDEKQARPAPNVRKEFKEVMQERKPPLAKEKNIRRKQNEDPSKNDIAEAEEVESESEEKPVVSPIRSLYGSGNKGGNSSTKDTYQIDEELQESSDSTVKESPFTLFKQLTADSSLPQTKKMPSQAQKTPPTWEAIAGAEDDIAATSSDKKSFRKEKTSSRFDQEQSDIAAVNQLGGGGGNPSATVNQIEEGTGKVEKTIIADLKEIVDQIVDKLYTLETKGQHDTIIVLKQPPIFEGAQVVVTSFKNAGKEFNLAFENLKPDAKALIDSNINALRLSLEEKGYPRALHIVTSTTYVEHRIIAPETSSTGREREKEGEPRDQGKKREQQKNEDLG